MTVFYKFLLFASTTKQTGNVTVPQFIFTVINDNKKKCLNME